jgi:hypothetical protein
LTNICPRRGKKTPERSVFALVCVEHPARVWGLAISAVPPGSAERLLGYFVGRIYRHRIYRYIVIDSFWLFLRVVVDLCAFVRTGRGLLHETSEEAE